MTAVRRYSSITKVNSRAENLSVRLADLLLLDRVRYEGATLPPKRLRFCGSLFQDEKHFLSSARKEAERLVGQFGMSLDSSVLDVGCGQGRLPIGILDRVGEIRKYRGIDVDQASVRWCQRYIARRHPGFEFERINVKNLRYNRSGLEAGDEFRFPFSEGEFDIIFLYSVFSHMNAQDVRVYLRDFRRVLRPEGRIFLTAFIEEGVPDVTENPEDYRVKWRGRLHGVRYDKGFFERMLAESGFRLDRFDYEAESNGQSGLYISRL